MSRFVSIQTNFSTGELDPLLRARVDLTAYANALEKATNVVCQPQGGIRRRPGTRYITSLENTGADSAANGVRLVEFEFSTSDSYMLCFTHNRMYIFKNKVLITNINGTGNPYLSTSSVGLVGSTLANIVWTQSADTLIVVHPDIAPVEIVRGASDSLWTAGAIAFESIPKYNFTSSLYNPAGTLTPSAVAGKVTLTASEADVSDTAQAGSTSTTIVLAAGSSATNDVYNGRYIRITGGTGSGQLRVISDYVGATTTATISAAWTTTPDATSTYTISIFSSSSVGQYINVSPQGRAKIVRFTSGTVVDAITEFPFFNNSAIATGDWDYESGYEAVWSSSKGYPRSVTFHEGRLFFGGSKSRPSTIWGSKVGLFFAFEATEGLDDDAVEATLDTNTFNAIVDIISGRDLQVFTTGGEFYVPQSGLDPITPTNFFVKTASRNGTQQGIRVQQLESGTLFVQRQGKSLNEFAYTDTQATYVTQKISLLAGHLLKGPSRLALRRSVATDENDLLLMTNTEDGTMAVFSLLRAQNVIAPSEFITVDGAYIDVSVDISTIYTVVRRNVNGVNQFYVEAFEDGLLTDSAKTGTGVVTTVTMPHLVTETVNILEDGSVQANQAVPASGTVTLPRATVSSYEIGLPITVLARTMPVDLKLQTGTRLGFKKRIVEVNALVVDTQHMKINDKLISFRQFGDILDESVAEFTGTKTLHGILGYSQEAKITISQDIPQKMTLLGMEYKVATHQGT
jgi:hypothetical protein